MAKPPVAANRVGSGQASSQGETLAHPLETISH